MANLWAAFVSSWLRMMYAPSYEIRQLGQAPSPINLDSRQLDSPHMSQKARFKCHGPVDFIKLNPWSVKSGPAQICFLSDLTFKVKTTFACQKYSSITRYGGNGLVPCIDFFFIFYFIFGFELEITTKEFKKREFTVRCVR